MSADKFFVDKFFKSLSKKQRYLGFRIIMVFLLVVFGLEGNFTTANITTTLFYDTFLLFFCPLFVEYLFGMDAYSGYTNTFRWIGIITTGLFVFVCFMGLMGKAPIHTDDETHLMNFITFLGIPIYAGFLKIYCFSILALTVFDFLFTFNKREKVYYKMQNILEDFLETKYAELINGGSLESRTEEYKAKFLGAMNTIEVEGGKG